MLLAVVASVALLPSSLPALTTRTTGRLANMQLTSRSLPPFASRTTIIRLANLEESNIQTACLLLPYAAHA